MDYFLQHPVSQSVTLNGTFTLACRIRESLFQDTAPGTQKATVQWVRNKFGPGTTREDIREAGMEVDSLDSRYDLPYNLEEGQCHLVIKPPPFMKRNKFKQKTVIFLNFCRKIIQFN